MARYMAAQNSLLFAPDGVEDTSNVSVTKKPNTTDFRQCMSVFLISRHL